MPIGSLCISMNAETIMSDVYYSNSADEVRDALPAPAVRQEEDGEVVWKRGEGDENLGMHLAARRVVNTADGSTNQNNNTADTMFLHCFLKTCQF